MGAYFTNSKAHPGKNLLGYYSENVRRERPKSRFVCKVGIDLSTLDFIDYYATGSRGGN